MCVCVCVCVCVVLGLCWCCSLTWQHWAGVLSWCVCVCSYPLLYGAGSLQGAPLRGKLTLSTAKAFLETASQKVTHID